MYHDLAGASRFLEKWREGSRNSVFSVIRAIAASETVYVAAGKKGIDHAKAFAESLKKERKLTSGGCL
mgnify:CR=1 FL=1